MRRQQVYNQGISTIREGKSRDVCAYVGDSIAALHDLLSPVWDNRFDVHNSGEQVIDNLVALGATDILDLLQLDLILLLGILLGLLVATGVLQEGVSIYE